MLILAGIISILYASFVVFITLKKPDKIWAMQKIQFFEKRFGPNNTIMLFYVWALLFFFLGFWLMAQG